MSRTPEAPPPKDAGARDAAPAPSSPGGTALDHAPTSQEAIAAFRRFWSTELQPKGAPAVERLSPLIQSNLVSAVLRSFAEYRQLVQGQPILFGGLDLLRSEGKCWDVHFDGMLSGGVSGCVDARDGRILLIWETPEG